MVTSHRTRTVAVPSPQAAIALLACTKMHRLVGRPHTIPFLAGIINGSIPPAVPVLLSIPNMAVQRALDDYLATEWPPYAVPVFTQAQMLALPLAALNLTTRPHNCLEKRVNILGDIITYGESRLRDMRNFGPGCVRETRSKLALYDLVLGE